MALVKGIHHYCIKAPKEKRPEIEAFYTGLLGLPLKREWEAGYMFDAGNALIEVFYTDDEPRPQGTIYHIALATDDPDACLEAVRKAGYEVKVEPKDIVIPSKPPVKARIAFAFGPVNEELEFFCER